MNRDELRGGRKQACARALVLAVALTMGVVPAMAQTADGNSATATQPAADASADVIAGLEGRVKALESQIVDLRTMIGTLQSLKTANGNDALPWQAVGAGSSGGGAGSVEIQALTAQVEDLARRLSRLESGGSAPQTNPGMSDTSGPMPADTTDGRVSQPAPSDEEPMDTQRMPGMNEERSDNGAGDPNQGTSFSSNDQQLPEGDPQRQARLTEPDSGDAETLYKDAYSHMLARDYDSAERAFQSLIRNHPDSTMAGNAQYWLGETYYVRNMYREAADSFLKAYRQYPNSVKAPDSLMKLAFSLARLGQKEAACRTFDELDDKYPNAPSHVKQRAGMEQRRAGCE